MTLLELAERVVSPIARHPFKAYAVAALLTFALEASQPTPCDEYDIKRNECPDYREMFMNGYAAGLGWPIYWTWTLAIELRGGDEALRARAAQVKSS